MFAFGFGLHVICLLFFSFSIMIVPEVLYIWIRWGYHMEHLRGWKKLYYYFKWRTYYQVSKFLEFES